MTKGTPNMVFMSEATTELLGERPDDLVFVGEFEVRGRQAKMRVWSIPDPDGSSEAPANTEAAVGGGHAEPAGGDGDGSSGDEPVVNIL